MLIFFFPLHPHLTVYHILIGRLGLGLGVVLLICTLLAFFFDKAASIVRSTGKKITKCNYLLKRGVKNIFILLKLRQHIKSRLQELVDRVGSKVSDFGGGRKKTWR